jgi:hypothetical protein
MAEMSSCWNDLCLECIVDGMYRGWNVLQPGYLEVGIYFDWDV